MKATYLIALFSSLDSAGGYLLPEKVLFADMNALLSTCITSTECRQLLHEQELKQQIVSQRDEFNTLKWKITDNGRARLAELR